MDKPLTANSKLQTREQTASIPFFSIIVPVYNVAPYLRECLDSVLAQTFTDWECICVNDGSTDESAVILEEYVYCDPRIHVIHQANRGLSAARNRALVAILNRSVSQYVTFIDADDWVAPNYLETLYQGTQSQTGCVAVGVQRIYANESAKSASSSIGWRIVSPHDFWAKGSLPMTAWAKAFPKRTFAQIRFPEGRYHEDEAIIYQILFQDKTVAVTSENLYYYRQRKSGIMGKASTPRALDLIAAHEAQMTFFTARGDDDLASAVQCRLVYEYAHAAWSLGQKDYLQSLRRLLMEHPRLTPFTHVTPFTMWLTAYVHYPICRFCDLLHRRGLLGTLKQFLLRFKRGT